MKVAIVYESNRGHTAWMADAVAAGVREEPGKGFKQASVGQAGELKATFYGK